MSSREQQERRKRVVLTGAWQGGKSTFIRELAAGGSPTASHLVLPEAAHLAREIGFDLRHPRYERHVVAIQHALEDAADLGVEDDPQRRVVITHRGSLDALAFYLWRGDGDEASFFELIDSSRERELARYDAVIIFRTTASGAPAVYRQRCLENPRPEPVTALELERWLEHAWRHHPGLSILENEDVTWAEKSARARAILEGSSRGSQRRVETPPPVSRNP